MLNLNYKKVQSTDKPKTVDITSTPGKVYMRDDIKKVVKDDVTYYEYDEALLTAEEYEEYKAETTGPFIRGIMQAINDIQLQIDELEI